MFFFTGHYYNMHCILGIVGDVSWILLCSSASVVEGETSLCQMSQRLT